MYDQAELDLLAAQAKKELAAQQNGVNTNENIYADIMNDLDEGEANYSGGYTDNQPQPQVEQQPQSQGIQENEQDLSEELEERITRENPDLASYDETLFPGGPTKSQINLWKKEWDGYDLFVTQILSQMFVFRTMNRFEYKQLVSYPDIDALMREETICKTVTLWPKYYNYKDMAVQKAGIPSTYSEIIMEKSGFTKDYAIEEL